METSGREREVRAAERAALDARRLTAAEAAGALREGKAALEAQLAEEQRARAEEAARAAAVAHELQCQVPPPPLVCSALGRV